MFEQKRKILIWILISVIIIAAIFAALILFDIFEKPVFFEREKEIIDNRPTARNAFDIALLEAQKWQADVRLAFMNSGAAGETGRSSVWKLIFVSKQAKGKGYVVEVADYKAVSTNVIPLSRTGADFPTDLISPEEAIKTVRSWKGYENIEILGVEAEYNSKSKLWMWAIKTPKFIVSVKASR